MGAGESLVCLPGRLLSVRETVGAPPCAGGETQPGENGPHTRGGEGMEPSVDSGRGKPDRSDHP